MLVNVNHPFSKTNDGNFCFIIPSIDVLLLVLICFWLQIKLLILVLSEFILLIKDPRKNVLVFKAPPQGLILNKVNYD